MDLTRPGSAVLSASTQSVVAALAGTVRPLTGREVARLAEISHTGAQRVLARLVEHGVVHAEPAGRAMQYTLNRRHLVTVPLLGLLRAREELVERLASHASDWDVPAVHVSIFGSAARGDGDTRSDLDVLVVRPDGVDVDDAQWRAQLDELAELAFAWTGNRLAWLEFSSADVAAAVASGETVIQNWRADSVLLAGESIETLLRPAGSRGRRKRRAPA